MDKIAAQVRSAEVRGAMAAFVDAGLVKVASKDAFEQLCGIVADNLGEDYDLQKVAAVTEQVLVGSTEEHEKTAAEKHDRAVKAALGDLLLQKTAGQIDDEAFKAQADELMKMAGVPLSVLRNVVKAKKAVGNAAGAVADAGNAVVTKGKDAVSGLGAAVSSKANGIRKDISDAAFNARKRGVNLGTNTLKEKATIVADDMINAAAANPGKAALIAGSTAAVPVAGLGAKALYDKYNAE